MKFSTKAFTLIEILAVIAIMWIMAVAISYFANDTRASQLNAERLASKIYDTVRLARNNMIIGRGVFTGGALVVTNQRNLIVSSTGILITYWYGTNTGVELTMPAPFINNDTNFVISDISVSSGGISGGVVPEWDYTGATNATITLNPSSDIVISANSNLGTPIVYTAPASIRTLKITAGYKWFEESVVIDRVNGTVEIKKSTED